MSKRITAEQLSQKANILSALNAEARRPTTVDRSFEMPSGLYLASAALFLAFLAILVTAFATPGLIIPMAIFTVFIAGFYGLPAVWTKMKPDNAQTPMTMGKFERVGIMTNTGRLNAREATIQMLILPVLIVFWALAVVIIAALV